MGGGSFESRLMNEMREKNGLVYSVYSYLNHQDAAPTLEGSFATQHNKVIDALSLFEKELNKMKIYGITEKELKSAKSYALGSFPLKLDSYEKLVNYLNFMQVKNLGSNFLETRNDRVRAVSFEDITRVRENIFSPEDMTIVIVGQK
jgi:zinc protease